MRKDRGFTLLELMTAVAILGIFVALAASGWSSVGARGAVQNAANDFHSALLNARQRASERGSDVWVIVYPYINRAGAESTSSNQGAWFVVEDADLNFDFSAFAPPSAIYPSGNNRLLEAVYLEDYPRHNVRFLETNVASAYKAPFASLTAAGCSFCDGTKKRGAVVFSGEGTARFIKDDGKASADRTASLSISSVFAPAQNFFFVVSGPTGFVGQHQ